jgi:glycosidase
MLRFLENHDEQRIASSFFAGDPFKGLPAMLINCFLYNGPAMIYFGQEVGERAEGQAGFSKDDGRTSIYDYWSVPSHQKWMNEGKFDGGLLNGGELKLRKLYRQILNICKSHPAIISEYFFDLYDYNISLGNEHNDQIYYFLRFTQSTTLLIVVNFSDQKTFDIYINIPSSIDEHDLFSNKRSMLLNDLLGNHKIPGKINIVGDSGHINLKLLALACHVFEF